MNIFCFNVPVDRSYRTVWYKYPDKEPIFYCRDLPDIPLQNEMTIDVPIDQDTPRGGVTYVVIQANFLRDNRGYFVDDIAVYPGSNSTEGVMRLRLTVDIWVTTSILNQVQWRGYSGTLPNPQIAGASYMVGTSVPYALADGAALVPPMYNHYGCRLAVSLTAKWDDVNYITLLSPPFSDYTSYQRNLQAIQSAKYIYLPQEFKSAFSGAQSPRLQVDKIIGAWLIPQLNYEINTSLAFDGEQVLVHDLYVEPSEFDTFDYNTTDYPGRLSWIKLGDLLNNEYVLPATFLYNPFVVTPRETASRNDYTPQFGRGFISFGNANRFKTFPIGAPVSCALSVQLRAGVNPVTVTLTLNGEPMDMTSSLEVAVYSVTDRVLNDIDKTKFALNGITSAVGVGLKAASGNMFGAASDAVRALSSPPVNGVAATSGQGDMAIICLLNGTPTFAGAIYSWRWNIHNENSLPTSYMVNEQGDKYVGSLDFNFFRQRPPANYETTGFFQLDNPRAVPLHNNYAPYGIIAKATDLVQRGMIFINPDIDPYPVNNDNSMNLDFDIY